MIAGLAAVLLLAAGVGVWQVWLRPAAPIVEKADPQKMAFPLPDKPSIAVLPFANLSVDPGQDSLADGITENIITVLSGLPQLFVISRNSTFSYKGKPVKVQQVAEELGVRYVLEGSVARSGDHIRATAQLIDALKGHHMWAERYDLELKDLFVLQDDLTKKILRGIGLKLYRGEEALQGSFPGNINVWLKLVQGTEYIRAFNIEGNNRARMIAEECMALEPKYWRGYSLMGSTHMMDYWLGSTQDPAKSLQTAIEYLEKAADLTDDDKEPYAVLGNLYAIKKRLRQGYRPRREGHRLGAKRGRCLRLAGHDAELCGREQEALPLFEKALRLNPLPPAFYYQNLGSTYRLLERYEEAINMYKKATALTPNNIFAHLNLAATYNLIGKEEEAKAAAAEVLRINPSGPLNVTRKPRRLRTRNAL